MVKVLKPTPKCYGNTWKLEKNILKKKDTGVSDGTGIESIKKKKVKKPLVSVETNEKKKPKSVKEMKVKKTGNIVSIIPTPLIAKEKRVKLIQVGSGKQKKRLVPESVNIKRGVTGSVIIVNEKKKKDKLTKVGLPPPPPASPSPKPETKPVKEKKEKLNKKAAKVRIGLPPPPTPSPEQPKPLAKVKTVGKKKRNLNLPPPPTPSPEQPKPLAKVKTVGKKKRNLNLPPPPTPSPEQPKPLAKVKTVGKKKRNLNLNASSTPDLVVKPKVEKLQKAKKELGKLPANKAPVAGKNSKKSSILKAKKLKGVTGKKAYDKRKLKKQKVKLPKLFEAVEYNEEQFDTICNEENIERIAEALKTLAQSEVAKKKTSIFSDFRYNLNVSCFKIPSCPKRMVKLNLKHSLVGTEDDVVIVVADVQRGAKADYEPTIQHYEDLFQENGIEGLKIMPFNQLRKECKTFEAVRKFGNTYDYFLADGRIVGQLVGFCGKIFQKPRTTFHSVHFARTNLKAEIERALLRTAYKQLQKGNLISIPIANHTHSPKEIAENAYHVINQLKTQYPGGMENVRGIYLKIDISGTSSLPIYLSMSKAPEKPPYVVGPREKRMLKLRKEANDILGNFRLSKEGDLIKLSKKEVERKREIKEAKAKLAEQSEENNSLEPDYEGKPQDNDGDEDVTPAKKARADPDVQSGVNKKSVEKDETNEGGKEDEDNDCSSGKSDEDEEDVNDSGDDDDLDDEDVDEEDDADEYDTDEENDTEGDDDDEDEDDE